MSTIELKVEDSYGAGADGYGAGSTLQQLSDGALVTVVKKINGSAYDHEIYRSIDNGNTWTLDYTIFTAETWHWWPDWVGDKLYLVYCPFIDNVDLKFTRVDYDAATQTFSTAINQTTIRSAVANTNYYQASCDVEPGGRVWCAYRHQLSGADLIKVSYSDDGGSTWAESTGASTSTGGQALKIRIHCLEGNTLFVFNYTSGGEYASYKNRLHTDSVNSWNAQVDMVAHSGSSIPSAVSCKIVESPCKRIWVFLLQDGNGAGNGILGALITEGASPYTLSHATFPSTGSLAAPAGETTLIQVSGRTNGAILHYMHSGSLTTLRRQSVLLTDTAWPGEATNTLAATPIINVWGCVREIEYPIADTAFLISYIEGTGSSARPWFLLNNVTSPVDLISDLPFETLTDLNLTADLLVEALADLNFTADLLAETLADLVWVADIPVEWFGLWLALLDSWSVLQKLSDPFLDEWWVIPTALDDQSFQDSWNVKGLLGGDFPDSWRVLPQELVALFNADIQLPTATVDKT